MRYKGILYRYKKRLMSSELAEPFGPVPGVNQLTGDWYLLNKFC